MAGAAAAAGGFVTRAFEAMLKECANRNYTALQTAIQAYTDNGKDFVQQSSIGETNEALSAPSNKSSSEPDTRGEEAEMETDHSDITPSSVEEIEAVARTTSSSVSVTMALTNAGHTLSRAEAELVLHPLRLAFETTNTKVVDLALDCLHKLIEYNHLEGDPGLDGGKDSQLVADILNMVCRTVDSSSTESTTRQALKVLQTAVASKKLRVHGELLLAVIRNCHNIALHSKSPTNQATAKAILTQMHSIIFGRMEADVVSSNHEPAVANSEDGSKRVFEEVSSSDHNDPTITMSETLSMKQINSIPVASVQELQSLADGTDLKLNSLVAWEKSHRDSDKQDKGKDSLEKEVSSGGSDESKSREDPSSNFQKLKAHKSIIEAVVSEDAPEPEAAPEAPQQDAPEAPQQDALLENAELKLPWLTMDLVELIMRRVPFSSLMAFRSVCRHWERWMVTIGSYVKPGQVMVVLRDSKGFDYIARSESIMTGRFDQWKQPFNPSYPLKNADEIHCCGAIWLVVEEFKVVLYAPSLNMSYVLPPASNEVQSFTGITSCFRFGVWFDEPSQDYKVIKIHWDLSGLDQVYSQRMGYWSNVNSKKPKGLTFKGKASVSSRNSVNWIVKNSKNNFCILSFRMPGMFTLVNSPVGDDFEQLSPRSLVDLLSFEDDLYFVVNLESTVSVWVRAEECWVKRWTLDYNDIPAKRGAHMIPTFVRVNPDVVVVLFRSSSLGNSFYRFSEKAKKLEKIIFPSTMLRSFVQSGISPLPANGFRDLRQLKLKEELESGQGLEDTGVRYKIYDRDDSYMQSWTGLIRGPTNSVHEGRTYELNIFCDGFYPERPPRVRFLSQINMTGVNQETGTVEPNNFWLLSNWNPLCTMKDILLCLREMMAAGVNRNLVQPPKGMTYF